jgi:hypothetical protein
MRHLFKIMMSSVWLVVSAVLAVQSASAQSGVEYPPADDPWDSTHYATLVDRVESNGLPLPTLSAAATKPVFERIVNPNNIPMRVGLNKELSVTLRFQKLDNARMPLHKLFILYLNETHKGKPYSAELARVMVYDAKATGALLSLGEPFLSTLEKGKSYDAQVANIDQIKSDGRELYASLVQSMTETQLYSKADMLKMIEGALNELPPYHAIFTEQNRHDLTQKLTKQISVTTDQQLKTGLTELRDAIEHRRVRT